MGDSVIQKPDHEEYSTFYAGYVNLVPSGDVKDVLQVQLNETLGLLEGLTESKQAFRYAEGKWSIAEVLGHIIDTERVMSYRLLRIARGDTTPLAGFDQDAFVQGGGFDHIPFVELLREYEAVRRSTIAMLHNLSVEALALVGNANGNPVSARALSYIIAGHERHHMNVLKERYFI